MTRNIHRQGFRGVFRCSAAVLFLSFASASAFALESGEPPTMAGESAHIKPAGERAIGTQERPTIKKKAAEQAREQRGYRVSLQIPEALRKTLSQKIDRRIQRNLIQEKKLRVEAMALLTKFIDESPDGSNEMPEALLRMGELEWEDARDTFLDSFQKWEALPPEQRAEKEPPTPNYAKARARFLKVLKGYKSFNQYDLALYVDGFLANEEAKFDESLSRFNKIIEWFPNSRFIPDAHMVRAEYEFTKDAPNYETAFNEYEQVLKYKNSELYDLAMFKSAWTLWRLGKPEEAAKRFLIVFQATDTQNAKVSGKRKDELDELQNEALKNLVAVFVEDENNRAEDMYRFLTKAGGDKFAGKIVRALADAFYDQAQYERGIEAYRLLLKLEPTSPEAYKFQLQIAQGHSTLENWAALEQDYKLSVTDYVAPETVGGKPKTPPSAWVRAQKADELAAAEKATEKQLREDAVGLHAKAQADKVSKAEFQGAANLYKVYLSRFGARPEAYEVNYNLAEIYFYRLENATGAAEAYMAAVRLNPKGQYSRTALYNALAALEVARAAEFDAAKAAGKKPEESPTDKQLTEAMELYIKNYPDDKQIPELLFRQGKLYYDYQVYDPAVRQWGLLLEKYPNSKYAVGAGELILDSFNKSKDYGNIETWARRLKTAPAFQAPAQQSRLNALIVVAVFKQGEQLSERGDHAKSAAAYLRAASEFPKEPRAAQAAVNAEVEAKRAGDLETMSAAAAVLIKDHPQREEAAQGVWIAATTFQEVGLFSKAADYHATIADNWPKSEHHKDAAYNAVLLRTTVGEHDKAIESGQKFRKYYPRDESADEVIFLMGKAHEKAGKKKEAEALYDQYSKNARSVNGQIEALVRLAGVKADDERGASAALDRAIHIYTQRKNQLSDRGKYYAAKARYMQGEAVLAKYEAVKIEGDVKQLKQRLKQKSELLKKAAETFLGTAEMGVAEWTTAALYQIGFTYESFSKALLNSPPPDKLSDQEKEMYKQSIDEFVVPIEERSLEAYESGWQKAIELGIFNSWTAKMREALGRLNSELYPPLKETGFKLRSRGNTAMPALIDGTRRTQAGQSEKFLISGGSNGAKPGKADKPGANDKAEAAPAKAGKK
ncbi:MAG TPA: tetratricopeptide repeat protein [Polyangiaceae bacterium]|nr:tetratricopeptide repeat protein [Polyangiaceae bacterium]